MLIVVKIFLSWIGKLLGTFLLVGLSYMVANNTNLSSTHEAILAFGNLLDAISYCLIARFVFKIKMSRLVLAGWFLGNTGLFVGFVFAQITEVSPGSLLPPIFAFTGHLLTYAASIYYLLKRKNASKLPPRTTLA